MSEKVVSRQEVESCLKEIEVTRFILAASEQVRQKDQKEHFKNCVRCYKYYFNLKIFYQILGAELAKPISPNIVNMVKTLLATQRLM